MLLRFFDLQPRADSNRRPADTRESRSTALATELRGLRFVYVVWLRISSFAVIRFDSMAQNIRPESVCCSRWIRHSSYAPFSARVCHSTLLFPVVHLDARSGLRLPLFLFLAFASLPCPGDFKMSLYYSFAALSALRLCRLPRSVKVLCGLSRRRRRRTICRSAWP